MADPLARRKPGWYVVNRDDGHVMRGPYEHEETAGAVRAEIERNATERQRELWNLWVVEKTNG